MSRYLYIYKVDKNGYYLFAISLKQELTNLSSAKARFRINIKSLVSNVLTLIKLQSSSVKNVFKLIKLQTPLRLCYKRLYAYVTNVFTLSKLKTDEQ